MFIMMPTSAVSMEHVGEIDKMLIRVFHKQGNECPTEFANSVADNKGVAFFSGCV